MTVLAVSSFVGGLCEAVVLVLLVQLAISISSGSSTTTEVSLGPLKVLGVSLSLLFWMALIAGLARLLLQCAAAHLAPKMSADSMTRLRKEATQAYMAASWSKQSSENQGRFQELVSSLTAKAAAAVLILATALAALFNLIALVGSAVLVSPLAAVGVLVAVVALFYLLRPLMQRSRRWSAEFSQKSLDVGQSVNDLVRIAQEARVFNVQTQLLGKYETVIEEASHAFYKNQFLNRLVPGLYQGAALLLVVGCLALLSELELGNVASLGAVVLLLLRALTYAQSLQSGFQSLNDLVPFLEVVQSKTDELARALEHQGSKAAGPLVELRLESVSYIYGSESTEALKDVSFGIAEGECIGIVGPSGAGKSTLVQLLLRLRRPTSGRILTGNGDDIQTFTASSWFRQLAYVPQDPILIDGSVSDNIRFFRSDIAEDEIQEASRRAFLDEEIRSLPAGYDTKIGPRDRTISGGQRQRLCFARALAGRPRLLILDEPTSSLDMRSEASIHETLTFMKGEVTLIIVAHRLSTLKVCDRIMVLEDGTVSAFESADELLNNSAFFREASRLAGLH